MEEKGERRRAAEPSPRARTQRGMHATSANDGAAPVPEWPQTKSPDGSLNIEHLPRASSAPSFPATPGSWIRRSEGVMIAYFLYAAVLSSVLPVASAVTSLTIGLNLTVIGVFVALAYASQVRPGSTVVGVARDWLLLAVLPLAYREMGWFAPARHSFELENGWIVWDRLLLSGWHLQAATEALGPLLPALFELCYSLVYAVGPLGLALLYFWGRRDRADVFLFRFLLGTVLSYALFPYFPSEPPRAVFPGENLPAFDTIFRKFNWWLLGNHGIHTSVFPSAHVSAAYAGAWAMLRVMPERRWAGWMLTLLATGILWATIYGRYHYAVDAVAGVFVAVAALLLCEWIERRATRASQVGQGSGLPK